jgi:hypothetical protein
MTIFFRSKIKVLHTFLISLALLLTACGGGGGGDSSSGGGSGTIYAGTYTGTFMVTATGPGGTVNENIAGSVIIANDGELFMSISGVGNGGSNCSAVPPTYLSGNTFSYSTNYTCTYPDLGTCNIKETGNGSINGDTLTFSTNGTVTCPAGTLTVSVTFTGTKQAIVAASVDTSNSSKAGQAVGRAYLSVQ